MSGTPSSFNAWCTEGISTQLPPAATVPLAASAQIGQGQLATFDASGNAALNDGTVPSLIAAGVGWPAKLSATDTQAAIAHNSQWYGFGAMVFSTGVGDGFTAADIGGVVAFIATENTIGRKSVVSGVNRSIAGIVYGLNSDGSARFWGGPMAQQAARALMAAENSSAGSIAYPADATASTDIGSTTVATSSLIIPRNKTHGLITSIEIVPSAALAATSGSDRTVTIWKLDSLGVNAAVSVGTFTTTTALVAQTRALFTLSVVAGALVMLETDILSYSTVHASSGAVIPQSAIRANMKVI